MKIVEELSAEITKAYEEGVTMPEAETLATKLLAGMVQLTEKLKTVSLDYRMRKSGLKAIRSATYLEEAAKHEKKPSDTMLENLVNTDYKVQEEQDKLDDAETNREYLESYMDIFREAHIHFRGIAKGRFE